jgi:endonuclease/exonuclease/phosphatase (EEP) superfamily protein YafD
MLMLLGFVRLVLGVAALGLAAAAIAAWFGFLVPLFDLLNHFQVLLVAGLLALLVAVLVVFIGSNWRWPLAGWLALGLLACGLTVVPETLAAFAPRPPLPRDGRPVIKLMTHNLFGLNYDMGRVARVIAAENPDIVVLQEYFPEQRDNLPALLTPTYPHLAYCVGGKRANIAIFSKLPFEQAQDGACTQDPRRAGRTAHILANFTLAGGQQFAVLTTHFDWPVPIERQREQRDAIVAAIKDVHVPLVVAGDFNSTPWSYAQRDFAAAAGLTRQTHGLLTWPLKVTFKGLSPALPLLPLDQVMTRGDVTVYDVRTGPRTGSDHLPVLATFSVGSAP